MTTEWTPMEPMQSDCANHADLFGGDIFSDELLDIYNSEDVNGGTGHDGVPLSNDLPNILDQTTDTTQATTTASTGPNNMGCDGLEELRSSNSMNDFTSILEEGNTPLKSVDTMLLSKENIAVTPNKVISTTAASVSPVTTTIAATNINVNNNVNARVNTKKRPAVTQQTNPTVKKKTTSKTCTKINNRGNNATIASRPITAKVNNVPKAKTTAVPKLVVTEDNRVTNNAVDSLTLQQGQKAAVSVATATQKVSTIAAATPTKVAQQAALSVSVTAQRPGQVQSSYQSVVKTPQLVSTAPPPKAVKAVSTVSTTNASSVKTEESFKGVAQAAVNNLILSAGQNAARFEAGKGADYNPKPVDTSTAHVAALTSNNWVAACAASISDAPPGTAEAAQAAALAAASDPAAAKAARARRASLTADERARQNRDRNREHARNTRLRKKAYVEELKRTLTELVTARDAAEIERRHEKQRELEVREVRFRVMEEFLKLRARGSESTLLARWVAILEDGFTLTLPKTGYRDMVPTQMSRQVSGTSVGGGATDSICDPTVQILRGAADCFDDASKLAAFLQSLTTGNIIQSYNCERKKFMMDNINAMLEWTWTACGQDNVPFIILKGCMRAIFSPASNKLVNAEILFDSSSIVAQTKCLMPFHETHNNFAAGAESDPCALLDSVLSQAPSATTVKQENSLCSASVVSADKGDTSDDDCQNQQIKKE